MKSFAVLLFVGLLLFGLKTQYPSIIKVINSEKNTSVNKNKDDELARKLLGEWTMQSDTTERWDLENSTHGFAISLKGTFSFLKGDKFVIYGKYTTKWANQDVVYEGNYRVKDGNLYIYIHKQFPTEFKLKRTEFKDSITFHSDEECTLSIEAKKHSIHLKRY